MSNAPEVSDRDRRAAALAAHLAKGVRDGDIAAADALRVLRHELRRRNTNTKLRIERRSMAAQKVIDDYASRDESPPKNGSPDALHADHCHEISDGTLQRLTSPEEWVVELDRLREVVCVTAAENYRLMSAEKAGLWGDDKYEQAGVEFVSGN